ncbi:interferon alpha-inducible protein 27-like protein 2A isoform X1 [Argopecten irradians]|uniref:interferon alpha-inducible protein 27-like protein 2A isoform X1 n=1 Tax=Argopecten irradians TaxID=31199 RepID=UPI003712AB62
MLCINYGGSHWALVVQSTFGTDWSTRWPTGRHLGFHRCFSKSMDYLKTGTAAMEKAMGQNVNMDYVKMGAVAIGVALVGAPVLAGVATSAVGFTSAGIASGSLAAKAMSVSALANGGGVAGGSAVAVLQSVGAAGLATTTKVAVGGAAAGVYKYFK